MPSTGGHRALTLGLVVVAVVLAVVAVALVTGGSGAEDGVASGGDPDRVLEDALAAGTPAYVLVHSAT